MNILVADMCRDSAESLRAILRLYGHEVRCATNTRTALLLVADLRPEVAIIDLALPVLDGFHLASVLRNRSPDAVLLALTGWDSDAFAPERLALFDRYLLKPTAPIDVLGAIVAARDEHASHSAPLYAHG